MKTIKLENLTKEINKINEPITFADGTEEDSLYNFVIEERNNRVVVYDLNENYHINWLEDTNCEIKALCEEFNRPIKLLEKDIMKERLLNALKLDLGENAYFEWENNVVLAICI